MGKKGNMNGILAPILNPYDEYGNVNYNELNRLAQFITGKGVHGLFVSGTSGEFVNLTIDERKRMLSCVRQGIESDKKIMFNITAMNLKDMEELIEYARKENIDNVSITSPYYHRYDVKTLINYFCKISEMTTGLNLYLYNMESMTGNPITSRILKEVVETSQNISGIKDSSMDFMRILEYQSVIKNDAFEIITGNDAQILTTLQAGGSGALIVLAGVLPELCMDVWNKFQIGDMEKAKISQTKILKVRNICRDIMPIMAHKYFLKKQGFKMGGPRFPFRNLSVEEETILENYIKETIL